ncbi:MAG: TonB-dependent receptor [Alphaproteobacteria bacterium]
MLNAKTAFRVALFSSVATAIVTLPQFAFAAEKAADVEELVVTGSRIHRTELTSVQPIQVLTSKTLDERGFNNVADAINELPASGVPVNPIGDQGSFGTGRNFVNIFNLGTNRTLTLVNGRRFVGGNPASIFTGASAGGQVDLNVIPTGLVDRIETIQAGGSAIYGSDAIAGVINIITKTDYEGVEIDGTYGVSDKGDGEDYRGRITAGHRFLDDKLSISASYEYDATSTLGYQDRDVTRRQIAFAANPLNTSSTDTIPGAIIILNRRIPEVTQGGLPFRTGGSALSGILTLADPSNPASRIAAQFDQSGNLIPYITGTFYQASIASGGDGLNLADLTSLQSPVKRHVANAFVKYDLTNNIKLTTELLYAKSNSEEPFNQPIYNAALFGGNSASLRMSTSNPFLSAQAKAAILAQPTALPADAASAGDRIFYLARASTDIGSNKTTSETETYRAVFGIDGKFEFAGRNFFWNASYNDGISKGTFRSPNIDQAKFLLAIDPVKDASGAIVCRDVTARAAGCQPLNLFGKGAPSKAALNYVGVQFESVFRIEQTDYQANFGGDLFNLPAGPVSFAAGYEYRHEKSDFNPNDPQERGVGRSAAITPLVGKFHTNESYAEILIPVFGGEFSYPLLRKVEIEASYRDIDHSIAGRDSSYSYGGRWTPFEGLMFRAQKSRSFRAPAITEIALPTATSFITATDPCDSRNITTGPNPTARQANCQAAFTALGLPASYNLISQVQSATVQGTTSGNPNLKNEIAEQWTAGFVYQPTFVKDLVIHFDYVHIDLTKAIANFGLSSILQVCYDSPGGNADACGRFQRGTSAGAKPGQVLGAGDVGAGGAVSVGPRTGYINAGYTNFTGFTAGVDYRLHLADLGATWFNSDPGQLDFNLDVFHVDHQATSVTGLGFDLNRDQGEIGNAKYQWKLDTAYRRAPWRVSWTTNWTAKSSFNNDFTNETRFPLTVKAQFLHDLSVSYDLDALTKSGALGLKDMRARFIVNNVFDTEPPWGTSGVGVYDVLGRHYQVGLTAKF